MVYIFRSPIFNVIISSIHLLCLSGILDMIKQQTLQHFRWSNMSNKRSAFYYIVDIQL